jgi:DoxX-like protein
MPLTTKQANIALWIIQVILAGLYLFAGGYKLAIPLDTLAKLAPLPPRFLKFIGACEVLGAFGLILPGLLRVKPGLTPLAAVGLVVIMIGAVIMTVATLGLAPATTPFVAGLLAATVARGRWPELQLHGASDTRFGASERPSQDGSGKTP